MFVWKFLFCSGVLLLTCFGALQNTQADSVTANQIVIVAEVIPAGGNDSRSGSSFRFVTPTDHTITTGSLVDLAQYSPVAGALINIVLDVNTLTNIRSFSQFTDQTTRQRWDGFNFNKRDLLFQVEQSVHK
jgi:hypothetical protein